MRLILPPFYWILPSPVPSTVHLLQVEVLTCSTRLSSHSTSMLSMVTLLHTPFEQVVGLFEGQLGMHLHTLCLVISTFVRWVFFSTLSSQSVHVDGFVSTRAWYLWHFCLTFPFPSLAIPCVPSILCLLGLTIGFQGILSMYTDSLALPARILCLTLLRARRRSVLEPAGHHYLNIFPTIYIFQYHCHWHRWCTSFKMIGQNLIHHHPYIHSYAQMALFALTTASKVCVHHFRCHQLTQSSTADSVASEFGRIRGRTECLNQTNLWAHPGKQSAIEDQCSKGCTSRNCLGHAGMCLVHCKVFWNYKLLYIDHSCIP